MKTLLATLILLCSSSASSAFVVDVVVGHGSARRQGRTPVVALPMAGKDPSQPAAALWPAGAAAARFFGVAAAFSVLSFQPMQVEASSEAPPAYSSK
jgi:hypothetical protein